MKVHEYCAVMRQIGKACTVYELSKATGSTETACRLMMGKLVRTGQVGRKLVARGHCQIAYYLKEEHKLEIEIRKEDF